MVFVLQTETKMGTYTTNYNLYMPTVGEQSWGTLVNGNFTTIDTTLNGLNTRLTAVENEVNGALSCTSVTTSGKITANGGVGTTSLTTSSTITSTGLITGNGGVKGNLTGNVVGTVTGTIGLSVPTYITTSSDYPMFPKGGWSAQSKSASITGRGTVSQISFSVPFVFADAKTNNKYVNGVIWYTANGSYASGSVAQFPIKVTLTKSNGYHWIDAFDKPVLTVTCGSYTATTTINCTSLPKGTDNAATSYSQTVNVPLSAADSGTTLTVTLGAFNVTNVGNSPTLTATISLAAYHSYAAISRS